MPYSEVLKTLEESLIQPAVPALIWMTVFRMFPAIRNTRGIVVLSTITLALMFRERLPAWMIVHSLLTLLLFGLMRLPVKDGLRWNRTRWLLAGLTVIFLVGRSGQWNGIGGSVFASTFPGKILDMLVFLKLFSAIWEVGSGKIKNLETAPLLAWMMMPWGGILLRLSDFSRQWPALLSPSWKPVGARLFKFRLLDWSGHLAICLLLWMTEALLRGGPGLSRNAGILWNGFVAGPVGFYLIAHLQSRTHQMLAAACGIELPDNYNRPFGRTNISEFWTSWNITYTSVFRDFFFYNRWGLKRANPYLNSIILFTLVGVWHSANAYWVLWGLMHGLGFAAFLFWKQHLKASGDRIWPARLPAAPVLSSIATYGFVCLCWLLPPQIIQLFRFMADRLATLF